jgi:glycosyltransferase involved in cell wall biosynthesis
MISVLILTYNEEINLPECLKSVSWCDDVVVFDSISTDKTSEIARSAGARVFQRPFDNYSRQREAARTTVPYKYPWVLALDADERVTPELRDEICSLNLASTPNAAFRMRRKDMFQDKWIRHATLYPSWFLRLYRNDAINYKGRSVHEYPQTTGPVGILGGHLLHFSFNKGLGDWLRKHVAYAEFEARENIAERGQSLRPRDLFSRNPLARRAALKRLSLRLPFRPTLRFLYSYVMRLGILDGRAGLVYCRMIAMYEYFIVLQLRELERISGEK